MLKLEKELIKEIKESTDNYPLSNKLMAWFIGDLLYEYFEVEEVYYNQQDYYEDIYNTISDAKSCKIVINAECDFLKSLEFYFNFESDIYIEIKYFGYCNPEDIKRVKNSENSGYLCKVNTDGEVGAVKFVSKEDLGEILLNYKMEV